MQFLGIFLCLLNTLFVCAQASPQTKRIVLAASTVLDGKGSVLRNT